MSFLQNVADAPRPPHWTSAGMALLLGGSAWSKKKLDHLDMANSSQSEDSTALPRST
ncbi:hypothetical protein CEP52_017804, partial [Fusarium oligoseptatum]